MPLYGDVLLQLLLSLRRCALAFGRFRTELGF